MAAFRFIGAKNGSSCLIGVQLFIDTHAVHVAGRLFGIVTHAESCRRRPIRQFLSALLEEHHPLAYNYHHLDLEALICSPFDPCCHSRPLIQECATGWVRTTGSS